MTLEVLVAAMNQANNKLVKKMNLQTNSLIGNQCQKNEVKEYYIDGNKHTYYSFAEKGVGLNRNNTLLRAKADIVTFADEDMVFIDGYERIIVEAFEKIPDADAIIFNIETIGNNVGRRLNSKIKRVHFWNFMNYGTVRISIKNKVLRRENITFNLNFGGGALYSAGEDSLFIYELLKHKAKIYTYPITIGSVKQTDSTWFKGYNEKYFFDKGALFAAMIKRGSYILSLIMCFKHRGLYSNSNLSFLNIMRLIKIGNKSYKKLEPYNDNLKKNIK